MKHKVDEIVNVLNLEFMKEGAHQYITSNDMITCAHLFIYGWLKTSKANKEQQP